MSITISYEAVSHRLRLEGRSETGDVDRLREAIDTFGHDGGRTILDLTAVTHLDDELAELVVVTRESASEDSHSIILLRRAHSQVDAAIVAAEKLTGRDTT